MAQIVNLADVQDDLINFVLANLPVGFTEASVKLPNLPFNTPNDKWLRLTFLNPVPIDVDATGCYKEYQGFFVIDVFYAKNSFPRECVDTAQKIHNAIVNQSFDYSCAVNCDIVVLGELDNWNQAQVVVTYQYGSYLGVE